MRKVLVVTLAFCLLLVLGTAFLAPLAYASSFDGTNPHTTGCDSSASTEFQVSGPSGLLELRYSSSCQTAWARFTCNQSSCTNYSIYVRRNQDGVAERVNVIFPSSTAQGASLYTLQLDDGVGLSAMACLFNQETRQTTCTNSF